MLTFQQFVSELARVDVALSPAEVRAMIVRLGEKVLQMGNLQNDGSLLVPVDCIIEAAQALGSQSLTEAVKALQTDQVASMLESADALVEKVSEARERRLREIVRKFQGEPDADRARGQWKRIEKEVFGVHYKA